MKNKVFGIPIIFTTITLVVVPLIYIVIVSFMIRDGNSFSVGFTLDNYLLLFEPLYISVFIDSFRLAIISTFFIVCIGYPFGYIMARQKKSTKKLMMTLLMIPFWVSGLIRLYGWIIFFRSNGLLDSVLMGLDIIDEPLKLLYSYPAVVTGMIYALLPFMIFSVYQSVEKIDWNLESAARDLGASKMRAFLSVTFPMTLPGLLSGVILTFIPSMGLFFIADVLGGNKIVLVGNIISDFTTRGKNLPAAAAMAVVLLILTYLAVFLYKKITKTDKVEGLTG